MPVPALIPAIVSGIVGNAVNDAASPQANPPEAAVVYGVPPRMLPPDALRGELVPVGPMSVEINGKPMMLSPGVQIRDPLNMAVFPGTIQQRVPVRYQTDPVGNLYRIWILSAQEAAQP